MKVMNRPPDPLLQEEVGHHSENMTEVLSLSWKHMLHECLDQISMHNSQIEESCKQRDLG